MSTSPIPNALGSFEPVEWDAPESDLAALIEKELELPAVRPTRTRETNRVWLVVDIDRQTGTIVGCRLQRPSRGA